MPNLPKRAIYIIILVSIIAVFLNLQPSLAIETGPIWAGAGTCLDTGDCKPCDLIQIFVNVGKYILGLVGAVALMAFVYGGYFFLTAGGDSGKIGKGRQIIVQSAIALAIVFFAYLLVVLIVALLTKNWSWQAAIAC